MPDDTILVDRIKELTEDNQRLQIEASKRKPLFASVEEPLRSLIVMSIGFSIVGAIVTGCVIAVMVTGYFLGVDVWRP